MKIIKEKKKNLPANIGDTGSISGLGRFHKLQESQAHASQLPSLCSRVHEPQLLSMIPTTTEASAPY